MTGVGVGQAEEKGSDQENARRTGDPQSGSEASPPRIVGLHPAEGDAPAEDGEHPDAGHGECHSRGDGSDHQDGRKEEVVGHAEEQHQKRAGAGDDSHREGEPRARTLLLFLKRGAGEAVVMSMVVVVVTMIFVMVFMTGVGVIPRFRIHALPRSSRGLDGTAQHHGSDGHDQDVAAEADGAVVRRSLAGGLPHRKIRHQHDDNRGQDMKDRD